MIIKFIKKIHAVWFVIALLSVSTIAVTASMSLNYNIPNAAITTGGGTSQSTSYIQADSAVGQSGSTGYSSSGTYQNLSGVVQSPGSLLGVSNWNKDSGCTRSVFNSKLSLLWYP